jgi:hypothetical protein
VNYGEKKSDPRKTIPVMRYSEATSTLGDRIKEGRFNSEGKRKESHPVTKMKLARNLHMHESLTALYVERHCHLQL